MKKVYAFTAVICAMCLCVLILNVVFTNTEKPKVEEPRISVTKEKKRIQEKVSAKPESAKNTAKKEGTNAETSKKKNTKPTAVEGKEAKPKFASVPEKIEAIEKIHSAGQVHEPVSLASIQAQNDTVAPHVPKDRFDIPSAKNNATILIVIDDAGRSALNTRRYASLPFPLTIAVLPQLPETQQCADEVRRGGKELILHQPMQAMNLKLDPGPGAIRDTMTEPEIKAIVEKNLLELGEQVKGMNNHEGSLITADYEKIGAVLDVCFERGVYFLDSRTTKDTQAPEAAFARGKKIFEKAGPYIDNEISREKMLQRIYETLDYANAHGQAIVIGHVDKSAHILPELLQELYPYLKKAGYQFATPSMIAMQGY